MKFKDRNMKFYFKLLQRNLLWVYLHSLLTNMNKVGYMVLSENYKEMRKKLESKERISSLENSALKWLWSMTFIELKITIESRKYYAVTRALTIDEYWLVNCFYYSWTVFLTVFTIRE